MILWQSLHVEVNRDNHGQASASGDGDQHELLPGHELDDQQGSAARMRRPPMIIYPIPVGLFFPRGRSPKVDRCRRRTDCAAEGSGEHHDQRRRLGRTFLLVLIIFVVTTAVASADRKRLVNEGASASLPRRKRQLPGAVSVVSWSWPSRCGPGAVAGRRRGRGARRVGTADPGRGGRSAVSWSRLV